MIASEKSCGRDVTPPVPGGAGVVAKLHAPFVCTPAAARGAVSRLLVLSWSLSWLIAAWAFTGQTLLGASVDEDWRAIVALDAGPPQRPKSTEEARDAAGAHLALQEKLLRAFLAAHPADAKVFEARLRLSRALQIRADMTGNETLRTEGRRLLDEAARTATEAQRPEVDFARISAFMRSMGQPTRDERAELLTMARAFHGKHPVDRRVAALLVEVAALFDSDPKTKLALLDDARPLAKDGELPGRIADDLQRTRLFGKTFALSGPTVQGRTASVEDLRGAPALVIFFADFSPPSTAALESIVQAVADLPKGSVRLLGVSLDERRDETAALVRKLGVTWPVIHDGKSWESPAVRALGINTLPTVWLLDAAGRLRSLNAQQGTASLIRQLRE
jgi:peroxiredoxin